MKHALAPRDLLLTLAVVTLLGFTFVPIKVGLRELPPFALAGLRFFFAAVPLVLVIRRPRMPWPDVVAYGLAIGVFQFGLLFLGMKLGMPAGLSSLVIQVQVFFTIGLAIAFLGDRLQRHNLLGAGIATAGIAILAVQQLSEGAHAPLAGLRAGDRRCIRLGRRQRDRQAGCRGARNGHVRPGRLVEPRPSDSACAPLLRLRRRRFGMGRRKVGGNADLRLRIVPRLGRDAVRIRIVGEIAPPLPNRAHRAILVAATGFRDRQRRDFSWRVARTLAGRRRRAGVRWTGGECLRSARSSLGVPGTLRSPK
jgi:hypothetical protein